MVDAWKGGNNERYRQYGDPVSMFDRSAHMSLPTKAPKTWSLTHDYHEMAEKFTSTEYKPTETQNPDGTTSLIG